MKATELMIGDWVLSPMGYPYKVAELHREYAHLDNSAGSMSEIMPTIGVKYEALSPIPLTAEILKKNGWKEAQFWYEYQDGKNTIQSCLPDMRGIINGVEIQNFKCEYVHQYQHLLRLCGLEGLADNFEIK